MLGQHSMKGVQRQAQPMISSLPAGRSARSAAALLETDDPLGLVASPPLPQGRSRDAATTANQASITKLFIKPDPAKSRFGVHCALLPFFSIGLWI
jgi:hypothetical protein